MITFTPAPHNSVTDRNGPTRGATAREFAPRASAADRSVGSTLEGEGENVPGVFSRSLVEGIFVYKTQKDFSKRVIAKYMRINDAEAIDESYQFFSRLVPAKPYIPMNSIKEVLLELGEKDPRVASLKPEDFADMSFVKELDESGFIDGLYKGKAK